MAPLLFAFGLKPRLAKLEGDLRARVRELGLDPNRVHLLAYLDDITVLVPSIFAPEALAAAAAAVSRFGLQLRMEKTQACSKGAACPAGLQEHWRSAGVTLVGFRSASRCLLQACPTLATTTEWTWEAATM